LQLKKQLILISIESFPPAFGSTDGCELVALLLNLKYASHGCFSPFEFAAFFHHESRYRWEPITSASKGI